ncbi:MAG: hypothetical protein HYR60_06345 [Acidobacteria bacterium]|nr:hypothetical protein [Acidobacteriota bacterium]
MAAKVYLDDLIDAMDSAVDDGTSYVDRETGEVHYVSREVMNLVENDEPVDSLPDWQQHEVESARLVVETDRMVATPSPFDIHEWEIMQEFALCLERKGLRDALLNALRGKGAFRHFKDTLRRHRIEEQWYEYRASAFRESALDWCQEHGIPWREGRSPQ